MFQFAGFAPLAGCHAFSMAGCPIRMPADQFVCADPRGFSQLIASFVASGSLGIPHTPLSSLSPEPFVSFAPPLAGRDGIPPKGDPIVPCTVPLCFSFSVRKDLDLSRTLSQYVNELSCPPPLWGRRASWRISESNRWPPACKAGALAS